MVEHAVEFAGYMILKYIIHEYRMQHIDRVSFLVFWFVMLLYDVYIGVLLNYIFTTTSV